MKIDFSDYKFHCSSIGKIMTESRTKDPLGETCKKHLIECYVERKFGRDKKIRNKYIEKGLAVEEESITLYARAIRVFLEKNSVQLSNERIVGTPDMINKVRDVKSSWDIWTFYNVLASAPNKDYWWQMQGYLALTGDDEAKLIYTLINTPENLIQQEMRRLSYQMGVIDAEANALYIEACDHVRKEMTFDDIPIMERYHEHTFKRDDKAIESMYKRVDECREFLNRLP